MRCVGKKYGPLASTQVFAVVGDPFGLNDAQLASERRRPKRSGVKQTRDAGSKETGLLNRVLRSRISA